MLCVVIPWGSLLGKYVCIINSKNNGFFQIILDLIDLVFSVWIFWFGLYVLQPLILALNELLIFGLDCANIGSSTPCLQACGNTSCTRKFSLTVLCLSPGKHVSPASWAHRSQKWWEINSLKIVCLYRFCCPVFVLVCLLSHYWHGSTIEKEEVQYNKTPAV